jgi:hypothetical protein
VTPERRASLLRMGMNDSYPEACSPLVMDADGDSIVAQALRSNDALCVENGTHSQKYSLESLHIVGLVLHSLLRTSW